jgi:hypothetical protein
MVPIIDVAAKENSIKRVNFREEKNFTTIFFCIELLYPPLKIRKRGESPLDYFL